VQQHPRKSSDKQGANRQNRKIVWKRAHLLQFHSEESKVQPLEQQLSCLMDFFMTGKNSEVDSLLYVDEFRNGAQPYFRRKRAVFLRHFVATKASLALLGLIYH
jgi:hypothetical protein